MIKKENPETINKQDVIKIDFRETGDSKTPGNPKVTVGGRNVGENWAFRLACQQLKWTAALASKQLGKSVSLIEKFKAISVESQVPVPAEVWVVVSQALASQGLSENDDFGVEKPRSNENKKTAKPQKEDLPV